MPEEQDDKAKADDKPEDKGDEAKAEDTKTEGDEAKPDEDAKADDAAKPDEKPADKADETSEATIADVEMPEKLDDLDEDALRAKFAELEENRKVRLDAVTDDKSAEGYELVVLAQQRIADEILGRIEAAKATAARVEEAKGKGEVTLPDERIPTPVTAATRAAAAAAPKAGDTKPAPPKGDGKSERPRTPFVASMGTTAQAGPTTFEEIVAASTRCGEGQTYLASVPRYDSMAAGGEDIPEPLTWGNIDRNDELINEAVASWRARQAVAAGDESEETARVAAICDPLDILRDIPDAFTDEERVAPVFPSRPAGRLGFQFTKSADLTDVSAGAGIFTETDQANVNPASGQEATWKKIVDFTCGNPSSVRALAVYAAARYDITLEISAPERLANLRNALNAARARVKEGRVLNLLDATLGRNLWSMPVGALPNVVEMVATVIAQASDFNRLSDPNFTVIIPPGFLAALVGDIAKRQFQDPGAIGDVLAQVRGLPGVSNIVQSLDGTDLGIGQPGYPLPVPRVPADAPGYVPELNQTFRIRLFDPADYIYAETGEMNAGVYRSTNEIRQNKAVLFVEEFVMLAKQGPQRGQYVDVSICGSGRRATGFDPGDCTGSDVS